ncbi:putative inactive serine/threonine-protein kinase scy1 [Madurella mycetomatis]|uniref:Inactive serine/threonine-protein kinase scy1 n=1 Tax=Madurella mycetomatis TaxID=100816 RepID=A0A175WAR7_9PEZI|nr:putative inactive serine/threonine-protein kinase scy1 [Madurella mycetomatis]
MDFLKSAVASAMAKGPPFPYTFGDKVDLDPSIWTLYNGTRREDGSSCSIFSFDIAANRSALPLAKNALKKLRTLRHPGVIKVLDTAESDSYVYIATERLVPLRWHVKRKSLSPETAKWGLYSVARTVKFINDEAASVHGNLKVASVYTTESGEWKLGGFEVLSNVKDDEAVIYTYGSLVPDSGRYTPPELAKSGWDAIKRSPHSAVDAYDFGALIFEVFNGTFNGGDQAGQTKNIPPSMHSSYKRLTNANPKARLSVAHFLEQGRRNGSFFDTPLIKLTDGVENLGVKTEQEREAFLDDLDQLTDDFPEDFFKMKVLPELLKSVEFGGGGPKAFGLVMKIAAKLSNEDFDAKVTPVLIRLFGNPDRAIRVCLLDNLPLMIDRLSQKVVNDKIFPQIVTGFTDVAPIVREQTLKSVLTLITKLSDRTINGELLKYLAKTANDEQPGIRTNTTICLGKIAKHLGSSSRAKVLIAAFSRSLRDPFVHARNAALMALAVTGDYFSEEDCAFRILPAVCPSLIDKEKLIRDQASKTVDIYLQKIRKAAANMPDTALPPETAAAGGGGPRMSTPQPTESATASWAGWAISSFTNKLSAAAGEIQASSASPTTTPANGPSRAAAKRPSILSNATLGKANSPQRQAVKSPPTSAPLPSSSNKESSSFFPDDDDADDGADAWGDMDDMDDGDGDGGGNNGNQPEDFFTADEDSKPSSTTLPKRTVTPTLTTSTATPFDDGSEPDFAGWLAAQAERKKKKALGGGGLPKGLAKTGSAGAATAAAKKTPAGAAASKAKTGTAVKKIDMKPKETDDDDGWGGW